MLQIQFTGITVILLLRKICLDKKQGTSNWHKTLKILMAKRHCAFCKIYIQEGSHWEFPGGFSTFTVEALGSVPGQGAKTLQAAQLSQKKKKESKKKEPLNLSSGGASFLPCFLSSFLLPSVCSDSRGFMKGPWGHLCVNGLNKEVEGREKKLIGELNHILYQLYFLFG